MKKSLLFVAAIFAAVAVNAQGTWNCVPSSSAVDDVIATGDGNYQLIETPVQNAKISLCDGGSNWTVKSNITQAENFTGADGVTYSKAYIQGGTNGVAGSLIKDNKTSAHMLFQPEQDGSVYVAAKWGGKKMIYVAELTAAQFEEELAYDATSMDAWKTSIWGKKIQLDGTLGDEFNGTGATPDEMKTNATDVYAAVGFNVKGGNSYLVWVEGSKIMLSGVSYYPGVSLGINGITVDGADNANAPVYNLAGQRVSKDAKGILIQNGKKFIK